ncbi:MAG: hypothetical protein KF678_14080 [Phycisphaeraceae bacterium]|nr:hypothetical protein [Phycisphaeraceae bacterium]
MKRLLPGILVALAGLALPVLGQEGGAVGGRTRDSIKGAEAARQSAALPIKSLTLYRSGVGCFERRGMVDAGETVQLRFKTEQINDMLKSMVILDQQQALQSVAYGSKEPLERRLASFGVNIADNPSMSELLNRLRGSAVKIVTDEGELSGTIVNVESRPTVLTTTGAQGATQNVANLPWISLLTGKGVQSVNLTKARGFELLDKELAAELNKALAALAEHRAERVKAVDVTFGGSGARPVVVAYIHEMPVWKTSYRLVLPDAAEKKGDKDKGQPTIQGWAIVENTTDEDWENVQLSLVAGRPVSFQMDLYEPLFVFRPEIPVPQVPGVMPRMYAEGSRLAERQALRDVSGRPMSPAAAEPSPARAAPGVGGRGRVQSATAEGGAYARKDADERMLGLSSLGAYAPSAAAEGGEIGEVFQYQMKTPVSLERQRSAMLPILSSAIEGRRVSIFNAADSTEHPMRGVEIKNSTGLQLMPGPISVFDGAAYAGDAQIGHVTLGDKRLLAYSVDLDVKALVKEDSKGTVRKVRIVNGSIEQTIKQENKVSYAFVNKDEKRSRTIIVEQRKMDGWDLVTPKKALEETEDLYRFEVELDAKEPGKIDIVQERTDKEYYAVTGYDVGTLVAFSKDGKASAKVVEAVQKAAAMQATLNDTKRRIEQLDSERTGIDQDQNRIRQNMGSVSRDTELYKRYATKLNEQETRLEEIREQRAKEVATMNRQQAELNSYVAGLNVE